MIIRTEAIRRFLISRTHPDLSAMYNHDMECQLNVAQDNGERIDGEYKGRQWHGWTDGIQTWKSFRIPYNANTTPTYEDREMTFDIDAHTEGIGMTGWDWKNLLSRWVAYDFDAIVGHSDKHGSKLNSTQLQEVRDAASKIDWVTTRLSTSGKGIHLYVLLNPVPTKNHYEHAALARAILGQMSALVGFDFRSVVDVQGGNMWVWHRKMVGTDGLKLIKQGRVLDEPPPNWQDHIKVTSGRAKRTIPGFIQSEEEITKFEELTTHANFVKLDDQHKRLIKWLTDNKAMFWWNQDHHILIAHTYDLAKAHDELSLRGIFKTKATGRQQGQDHNCWLSPLRNGAWYVRRYGAGVQEDPTWTQDGAGWTFCYFNREPDLQTAARLHGGVESPKGGFMFDTGEQAQEAATHIGANLDLRGVLRGRRTLVKKHKDGRLIVEIEREVRDTALEGWISEKNKFIRMFDVPREEPNSQDVGNYDDVVRHLVTTDGSDSGWVVKVGDEWHDEPITHIGHVLTSMGLIKSVDLKSVLGTSVLQPWKIINHPFEPEYIGDRQWNRHSAQFRFPPVLDKETLYYPTWLKILNHIGKGLDVAIKSSKWAIDNGLTTGSDYLKCWIASLFKEPTQPLPYLFLWGNEDCGKSILHESLRLLITHGYVRADSALSTQSGFNAELENAVICVVEETNLGKNKPAYNRIKDWVTSVQLPIHRKYATPYTIQNTTHWIQCANERSYVPVFVGDTRITMIHVDNLRLDEKIPKRDLIEQLEKEASDFLTALLKLELPESNDRLNVPVVNTDDKILATKQNQNALEQFIDEFCFAVPGEMISVSDFFNKFEQWIDPQDRYEWSKIKVGKAMPERFPKGRLRSNGQWHYGNLSWEDKVSDKPPLIVHNGILVEQNA